MAPLSLNDKFEKTILSNLIYNEEFARKAVPFLKEEFFKDRIETIVFKQINNFVVKYNNLPTKEALTIELSNLKNITEEEFKQSKQLVLSIVTLPNSHVLQISDPEIEYLPNWQSKQSVIEIDPILTLYFPEGHILQYFDQSFSE